MNALRFSVAVVVVHALLTTGTKTCLPRSGEGFWLFLCGRAYCIATALLVSVAAPSCPLVVIYVPPPPIGLYFFRPAGLRSLGASQLLAVSPPSCYRKAFFLCPWPFTRLRGGPGRSDSFSSSLVFPLNLLVSVPFFPLRERCIGRARLAAPDRFEESLAQTHFIEPLPGRVRLGYFCAITRRRVFPFGKPLSFDAFACPWL